MNWQCPGCKGQAVSVTDEYLVCHSCGNREYLYDYANAHDNPMPAAPEPNELEDRVSNLEEISAQPGKIPRQYHDQFQDIRGQIAFLRNKIEEKATKQRTPARPVYKGLSLE